jgi:predicted nucleotidyltransferase component of viral defense system
MTESETAPFRLHEDRALFVEAVNFTAAETDFIPRLIEKDYFCSLLLNELDPNRHDLIFKGGTCLAKVHTGFYRLSEDLDFAIPTPVDASRAERRRRVTPFKEGMLRIGNQVPGLRLETALTGANDSTQYNAVLRYSSLLARQEETIKVEVSLREPLLREPFQGSARTLLRDPISGSEAVPVLAVTCLSRDEAMAEKLRAALSRRDVAIRDFYDVDHAVRLLRLDVLEPSFIGLVRKKLAVPGNDPADASLARLALLRPQLESQLRPVLRAPDYAEFDLDRAFATVAGLAIAL